MTKEFDFSTFLKCSEDILPVKNVFALVLAHLEPELDLLIAQLEKLCHYSLGPRIDCLYFFTQIRIKEM